MQVTNTSSDQYFGSRRVAVLDQLGSAGNSTFSQGTYYPWGEVKGGTNPQNAWSFATYWQDSASGLDYANNRYYSNAYGRFMTPDPYQGTSGGSGDPDNPQTWNRYAYVVGDPVNWVDPDGQFYQPPQQPPSSPLPPIVNSNQGSSPNPGGTTKNHNGTYSNVPTPLTCQQVAAGASNGATPGSVTAALNSAFNTINMAVSDLDQYVDESFTAAQMTWEFFSGTGQNPQIFGPNSPQSMSMAASSLLSAAIAAYLQNPSNPKNQSGVLNFGFTALLAAGVNPTQQFVGSFAFNISTLPNGNLDVTLTNTTSFSSLMRFVQYFGLPVPGSWSRGTFPIMGNFNQIFYLNIPCQK
jgi:RHS repeat-associated protein